MSPKAVQLVTDISTKNDSYERLRKSYRARKEAIKRRIREFSSLYQRADDYTIFEELVFCILTSNAGARMGLKAVEALRGIVLTATEEALRQRLKHAYRYPGHARYIVATRDYLRDVCGLRMKELIASFEDVQERRDFFARNKNIKGIGYKQASHFLRNIGFMGYAILDKHVVRSLYEYGVIESPHPPSSRRRYLEMEEKMKGFAAMLGIDFDELDLLLWSVKTGEILK